MRASDDWYDARAQAVALQRLTAALSEAMTLQDALAIVSAHVQEMLGATSGLIGLVTDDGAAVEIVQVAGYREGDLAHWARMPIGAHLPATDVVRSGAAQFWPSPADLLAAYPDLERAAFMSSAWAIAPLRAEGRTIGVLSLAFERPHAFGDDERAYVETLARQCATAIQRTRRYAALERSAARIARLQQVTAALGAAVTPEGVAEIIVREALGALDADAASVFGYDVGVGEFTLLGFANYPGQRAPQYARRSADSPGPLRDVLQSRELVLTETPDEQARRWPDLAASQRRTGDIATATVPLLLGEEVRGALHLGFRRPHRFEAEDRGLLRALGQQCAQALERARLYAAERALRLSAERTARRADRLYAVTSALAEAITLIDVARVIVGQGMEALGAAAGSVRHLSQDGATLLALEVRGYPPDIEAAWRSIPLDAPVPMAVVARTGEPLLVESTAELEESWPEYLGPMRALGYRAIALLPLLAGGRPIGTMSFGFHTPHTFDSDEREFLAALSRQCAIALERARLYAATEAQAARLGALAESSQLFAAASLDLPTLLDSVAHRVAATVGDLGVVGLLTEDRRELKLAAIAHADPEALAVMTRLLERFPLGAGEGISARTLATGQPQLLPVLEPVAVRRLVPQEYWPYMERFGIHSLMIAALRVNGEVIGTLGALRDTPGRPYAADDLTMLQELADRAGLAVANARLYQRAQEAVHVRDQFLSIAAHELKTPLTALYGQAQLIQRRLARGDQSPERLARSVDMIARQAGRLDAMVATLLDVGRLELGQFALDRQPTELGALAARVVEEVRPTLDSHFLTLDLDQGEVCVDGDPLRLEQVLQNLISNAVKYSPGGGTVAVQVSRDERTARVAVSDEGIGVPSAALPNLFQRFYRADNAAAQSISGMGVGLYVVHEIVARHGGTVQVESVEGQGSTFTIVLPLLERAGGAS